MQINETVANVILVFGIITALLILAVSIMAILQKKREGLLVWGKWTLLASLGFSLGSLLGGTVISNFNETLGMIFIGCILGIAEWLVLRPYLNNSSHWILATSIGLASGVSLTQFESHSLMYLNGVVLGATQFLVIGNQFRKSGWWIIANILGIAYWVFQIDTAASLSTTRFDWRFFGIVGLSTLVYSAITGVTLVWLLHKNAQSVNLPRGVVMLSANKNGTL